MTERDGTRWLLLAGIASPIVLWSLGIIVAVTWPGYDPISESISSMVHAPMGWLQGAAFWVQGGLGVAWAVGASRVMGQTIIERRLVGGLFLLQAGIGFAFAVLPTDPGGAHDTLVGRLHLANFYLYAISMPITLYILARMFRRDPQWVAVSSGTRLAGILMLASAILVPITVDGPLLPVLGLLERLYVAIPSVWQLWAAGHALRVLAAVRSN